MDFGICHLGLIPLRLESHHKSEMVSQLLYGDSYKILEKKKKWLKIRMEWDGYEGWIPKNQSNQISKINYNNILESHYAISTDLINYVTTYENLIFPILIGSDLRALEFLNHRLEGNQKSINSDKKLLSKTAFMYLNAPYLWGGRTPLGIDCSGFTQMIYKINGIRLKRDAYQQAEQGQTLSFIEESEAGDLAFFDDKEGNISHVGILLGNNLIIHAHGFVRIDKIDQSGIYDGEKHTHKLRMIKKII